MYDFFIDRNKCRIYSFQKSWIKGVRKFIFIARIIPSIKQAFQGKLNNRKKKRRDISKFFFGT